MQLSEIIEKSARVISDGGIILYPTDTIWGIGCDATNPEAIDKIYKIKKRADSKSLVSLVSDLEMLESITPVPENVKTVLAQAEKPTTIIYNNVSGIHPKALAPDVSAAIRIPKSDFCSLLINTINKPLISTSANLSGEIPPTGFQSVSDEIKDAVDLIIPIEFDENTGQSASRILKLDGEDVIVIRE